MRTSQTKSTRLSWLGSAAGLFAVVTCYGTLAGIALLSVIGISVDLSEGILVKLITGLLILALFGMIYSFRLHRHIGPLMLSFCSAVLLVYVFYGDYSKPLELIGFVGLLGASIWDFRVKKLRCSSKCDKE
ncbi:MAG: hypothetical protein IEMM0008_1758 [bacterium]|nr:MAG: hypothetical protein IEMM0008_1758 [bacterium]